MKLTDLNPRFVGTGGVGVTDKHGNPVPYRAAVGLAFDCPCGRHDTRYDWVYVPFENPPDGGPPNATAADKWHRDGTDFATMTLTPSILRKTGCDWHGFVTNGEVLTC